MGPVVDEIEFACRGCSMPARLMKLQVSNYPALAEVDLALGPINVLFGPNGAGKSTILDTIWFVRDSAIRSVAAASNSRDHGIGLLYDAAPEGSPIVVALATEEVRYQLTLEFSAGRIEPMAGERLESVASGQTLIQRLPGTGRADFFNVEMGQSANFELREPEKLSLNRYLDYTACEEAAARPHPPLCSELPFAVFPSVPAKKAWLGGWVRNDGLVVREQPVVGDPQPRIRAAPRRPI